MAIDLTDIKLGTLKTNSGPLRVVTVIPSLDQLRFAVNERTGLTLLTDLRKRCYPLKVSFGDQRNYWGHREERNIPIRTHEEKVM